MVTQSEKLLTLSSTWIIRLFFWATTIYIVYCVSGIGWGTPEIHVYFATIGCALLMIEAILAVSADPLLSSKLSKPARVRIHWILHILALASVLYSLYGIVAHKIEVSYPHWVTFHGKLGLISIILFVAVNVTAIPTLHKKIVPKFVNFGSYKRFHIYFGLITFILLGVSQISGLIKTWWVVTNMDGGNDRRLYVYIAYAIGGFLLIARPTYLTVRQSLTASS